MTIKKNTGYAFLLLAFSANLWAHGDVVPQAVKTEGLEPLGEEWLDENPYRGNARAAEIGRTLFNQTCARCHGVDAVSRNMPGPDLTRLDKACRPIADPAVRAHCLADNDAYFLDSVQNGKVRVGVSHMPAWKTVLSPQLIWTLRTFVESRAPKRAAE